MTISSGSAANNMGWEVAGGKKATKKPVDVKQKSATTKGVDLSKFPKQEGLRKFNLIFFGF